MNLLFDQNLSHRLVRSLTDIFLNSEHVRNVGLGRAHDDAVWQYAAAQSFMIVSKDSDFHQLSFVRGKYYRRLIREGANIAVLEPDVAAAFRDPAAVNDALGSLLQVSETTRRLTGRPTRPQPRRRSGLDATADAGRGG